MKNIQRIENEKISYPIRKKAYAFFPPDVSYMIEETWLDGEQKSIKRGGNFLTVSQEEWDLFFALCAYAQKNEDSWRYSDNDEQHSVMLPLGNAELHISQERAITLIEQLRMLIN